MWDPNDLIKYSVRLESDSSIELNISMRTFDGSSSSLIALDLAWVIGVTTIPDFDLTILNKVVVVC